MSIRPRDTSGFTLIELMLSVALVAGIGVLVWGSFSLASRGKASADRIIDRYGQVRLALNRMARELTMAYLSKNDQFGTDNPRTFFSAEERGRSQMLTFSALAHVRLREDAKECDQSIIRYFVELDPEARGQLNLMRRESRRLGDERPGEEGPAYVMLEDIEELQFEFYDKVAEEWRDNWNTRSADGQPDRLPDRVRILLTIKDEHDKPLVMRTGTRPQLKDALWYTSSSQ
jgi:general secretion pathway protein J